MLRLSRDMGCTVEELAARMSWRELVQRMVLEGIDPSGESRADLRMGILASVIQNMMRGKGSRAMKPKDFIPRFGRQKQQTQEDMKARFRLAAKMTTDSKGLTHSK